MYPQAHPRGVMGGAASSNRRITTEGAGGGLSLPPPQGGAANDSASSWGDDTATRSGGIDDSLALNVGSGAGAQGRSGTAPAGGARRRGGGPLSVSVDAIGTMRPKVRAWGVLQGNMFIECLACQF